MDGTEQTLFENTELGEYSGYIFLDTLESGDIVKIKVYLKDVEDNVYKKHIEEDLSGVLTIPTMRITPMIGKIGIKVTAEQTLGTYRTITYMWFKR